MIKLPYKKRGVAQAASEYLIVLAAVTMVVIIGWRFYIPEARLQAERSFNQTMNAVLGESLTEKQLGTRGSYP